MRNSLLSFAVIASSCSLCARSMRKTRTRSTLPARTVQHSPHEALRRLPGSWRRTVMGCCLDRNQPRGRTSPVYRRNEPAHRSEPWRSCRSGLGQYRQQGLSLPRRPLVWQGSYMSEAQAQAQGVRPDHGKACSS